MHVLIKSAKIVDPGSAFHSKTADILIENGTITAIGKKANPRDDVKVIEADNLHVSPGWFDMQVHFRDPGHEFKEDIISGSKAAAFGGYTGVACMPSTSPPIHTKAEVEYVLNKSRYNSGSPVQVYPVGALSYNLEGKDISEMFDMYQSGAVAFSDDKKSVMDAGLLLRALLYTKNFNAAVICYCDEKNISQDGKINEGQVNTMLGLKGIPALAEELMVIRNIHLAEYAGHKIHLSSVSTAGSVDLIRQAKAKGIKITAGVNAHHLWLDDSYLKDFDTNYKVKPPLRTKADMEALKEGLADGTIDVICSDHTPEDEENKKVEFDFAAFGMLGLQTSFAIANASMEKRLSMEQLVQKMAITPRQILGIPLPTIKEGETANVTFFDPERNWTLEEKHLLSKSRNTPFIGTKFKGKALGVYNRKALFLAE